MKYGLFLNSLKVGEYDAESDARSAFLAVCSECNFEDDDVTLIDSDGDWIAKF